MARRKSKLYEVECSTPRNWRSFKSLLLTSLPTSRRAGIHVGAFILVSPKEEPHFRELLTICEGRTLSETPISEKDAEEMALKDWDKVR